MPWLTVGMREEFVLDVLAWMIENRIRFSDPFEVYGVWYVMYMPIGRAQKEMCERYIEFRCNNGLM